MSDEEIAARVRQSIPPEMSYAELAARLGITADELACLLNADPGACGRPHRWFQRVPGGFASIEIAMLVEILGVQQDWLLFGEAGPPTRDPLPTISSEELDDPPRPVGLVELAAACGLLDELDRPPYGDDIPIRDVLGATMIMLDAPPAATADLFGVSVDQLQRWLRNTRTQPSDQDAARIQIVAQIADQLRHSFTGSGVLAWFNRVHPTLGRTPVDMLTDPANYSEVFAAAVAARSMTA